MSKHFQVLSAVVALYLQQYICNTNRQTNKQTKSILTQLYLKPSVHASLSLASVQTALRRWNHLLGVWPEVCNWPVSLPDAVALRLRSPSSGLEQQQQQQQQHCHLNSCGTTCGGETTLAPRQTHTRPLYTPRHHRYDMQTLILSVFELCIEFVHADCWELLN